jgi:NADH-quinone oxidoreductase subunit M
MNSLGFPVLSLMLAVPMIAAGACLFLSNAGARWTALLATLANLALGILLWVSFDIGGPQWQFVETGFVFGRLRLGARHRRHRLMLILLSSS